MNNPDVKNTIRQFVTDKFMKGRVDGRLADGDSFLENKLIDSTGVLELVAFIEETFNIKVEDEELVPENLDSLNQLGVFVASKLHG